MADQNSAPELRIDEKWSIQYDPENNDRPVAWLRHGVFVDTWHENNAVTSMFYALLEARADHAAPTDNTALVEALRPFGLMSTEGVVTKSSGYVTITTCAEYFHRAAAALTNHEAPPACQQESVTVADAAAVILRAIERAQIDMTILRKFMNGEPCTALRALKGSDANG